MKRRFYFWMVITLSLISADDRPLKIFTKTWRKKRNEGNGRVFLYVCDGIQYFDLTTASKETDETLLTHSQTKRISKMAGKKGKKKSQAKKQGGNDKKAKGGKKPSGEGKTKSGKSRFQVDIFTDDCMENAYYICHNIQDVLKCRGFPWPDAANKKKKGKKGK